MNFPPSSRRLFLKTAAVASAALATGSLLRAETPRHRSSGRRQLKIGLIGTGGRGVNKIRDFLQLDEDVIALCDVDPVRGENGAKLAVEKFPRARRYKDYRKMLEQERELDAVVVTTPDHMHAPISLLAMSRGLHVFCEKPLTRTIAEARQMSALARSSGVVTQMGTQGSASNTLRRSVEILRAGVIGKVHEIHIWCDRTPQLPKPEVPKEMPAGLDWDIWLGVAEERPWDYRLCPFHWRWWTEFGAGPLGDMGCHLTNLSFRGLDLRDPTSIAVQFEDPPLRGMFPTKTRIDYRFPERNGRAPVKLTWYDAGLRPDNALLDAHGIPQQFKRIPVTEKLIVGDKGVIYGDGYIKLHGEDRFFGVLKHEACVPVPESIPRAVEQGTLGHYREWVEACKGNGATYTGFDVAAEQTEMVLLGCLAVEMGRDIRWDAKAMRVHGDSSADRFIDRKYRAGFTI